MLGKMGILKLSCSHNNPLKYGSVQLQLCFFFQLQYSFPLTAYCHVWIVNKHLHVYSIYFRRFSHKRILLLGLSSLLTENAVFKSLEKLSLMVSAFAVFIHRFLGRKNGGTQVCYTCATQGPLNLSSVREIQHIIDTSSVQPIQAPPGRDSFQRERRNTASAC